MSDDKDDLRSIKVYKFNNTKENWHEFALNFRVIADSRGYEDIIDGTVIPLPLSMKKKTLKYFQQNSCQDKHGLNSQILTYKTACLVFIMSQHAP